MKRFVDTIKNIWSIEELRDKILLTLGLLFIFRVGSNVVLPGIDHTSLSGLESQTESGLLGILNAFTGGAFANASILALGIMPYISASIVIQLMAVAVPAIQKMDKEGESGRKKKNQLTRSLTILITAAQAPGYLANLMAQGVQLTIPTQLFWTMGIIVLIAGTVFAMWLGERITDKGIGNGISLLIMIGIIATLPQSFLQELFSRFESQGGGLVIFIIELAVLFVVIIAAVALVQAVRQVPVQYAKRVAGGRIAQGVGSARDYIPLKVNAAGVMPIIFAQAIMFIPITVLSYAGGAEGAGWIITVFSDIAGFWYNLVFAVLIILFTYFYTAIQINTNQMAEDLKRNGGFIPGIKPGKQTAEFIDTVLSRITLPGSIFLAILAILPAFAMQANVNMQFAYFFGGTSLLIMVGVVLDTLQQIESYLLARHYDGLMKSGRIKGRSTINA
jgi:preprotein translocase subunit SecY